MKHFLILVAACATLAAHAGTWGTQIHSNDFHFAERAGVNWNTQTDGFALRYTLDGARTSFQVGHYRNEQTVPGKFNFFTNYVYADYTPCKFGPVRIGPFVGIVSGFDTYDYTTEKGRPVILDVATSGLHPLAGIVLRLTAWKHYNITLRAQPNLPNAGAAGLAIEFGADLF